MREQDVVAQGRISGAQLETVIYANMRFNMTKENYGGCLGWGERQSRPRHAPITDNRQTRHARRALPRCPH